MKAGRHVFAALFAALIFPAAAQAQQRESLPLPADDLESLANTFMLLRNRGLYSADGHSLLAGAIRGMVKSADPDAEYFAPKEMDDFRSGATAERNRTGMQLVRGGSGGYIVIPFAGSAAKQAGIQPGDVLLAIDGKRVAQLELNEVVALLQSGAEGSTYTATVLSDKDLSVRTVTITRRNWARQGVSTVQLGPGVIMISIPQLDARTLAQTAQALTEAWQRERVQGVILDMRGNNGGLLDVAAGLVSIFLPPGQVVAGMDGRIPESKFVLKTGPAYYTRPNEADPLSGIPELARSVPLSILADRGTSSGAEIVVAALHDHMRAKVIGEPTWGRTIIQTVVPLHHGDGLKYTTGQWFTPDRKTIKGTGVIPDVEVPADSPAAVQAAIAALR